MAATSSADRLRYRGDSSKTPKCHAHPSSLVHNHERDMYESEDPCTNLLRLAHHTQASNDWIGAEQLLAEEPPTIAQRPLGHRPALSSLHVATSMVPVSRLMRRPRRCG